MIICYLIFVKFFILWIICVILFTFIFFIDILGVVNKIEKLCKELDIILIVFYVKDCEVLFKN